METTKKTDPIALAILAALEEAGDLSATELAQMIAEAKRKPSDPVDLWRKYLPAVKQQALHLARNAQILMIRKGEIVTDFYKVKGLVRYRKNTDI